MSEDAVRVRVRVGRMAQVCARLVCPLLVLLSLDRCSGQSYPLSDDPQLGREFDGVGGLSGGGVSPGRLARCEAFSSLPFRFTCQIR